MKRQEHSFQFHAEAISLAALAEARYHEERLAYWQEELEKAAEQVRSTIGAKLVRQDQTGGWRYVTIVDYGDPAAQRRLEQSASKIQSHQAAAERFRTEERLYATQGERMYELDTEDVHHYRLGGGPREE